MNEEFKMDSLQNLVEHSIELLRAYAPKDRPYFGAFSGGKDSVVLRRLADMAGVRVVWHYHVTTIDPPELVWFIRRAYPDVIFDAPPCNFLYQLEREKILPTPYKRWCCSEFKEGREPKGSHTLLGVRSDESEGRNKSWSSCDPRILKGRTQYAPMLKFKDHDVWALIRSENIPYCELYDEGFSRLGCLFCPLKSIKERVMDCQRWPRYKELFIRSLRKIMESKDHGFASAEAWFEWWINNAYKRMPKQSDQQFFDQPFDLG